MFFAGEMIQIFWAFVFPIGGGGEKPSKWMSCVWDLFGE